MSIAFCIVCFLVYITSGIIHSYGIKDKDNNYLQYGEIVIPAEADFAAVEIELSPDLLPGEYEFTVSDYPLELIKENPEMAGNYYFICTINIIK